MVAVNCSHVVKDLLVDAARLGTQADAIITDCGIEVCDGAYSLFVMKNQWPMSKGLGRMLAAVLCSGGACRGPSTPH